MQQRLLKTSAFLILLFATIAILTFVQGIEQQRFRRFNNRYTNKLLKSKNTNLPPYKVFYFKQRLDHYDFSNDKTWSQRYLICDSFVDPKNPNTPIFLYTGNEGDIINFYENTGMMFDIAPEFKPLILFIEHRYYGESYPFGKDSYKLENIKYLTSEQALADYVYFLTENYGLDMKRNRPVIAFGGSYGGMLSAWIRFKYPHVVDGAIAASAPIFQFTGISPPNIYTQICTEDFRNSSNLNIYKAATCDQVIKQGFLQLQSMIQDSSKYSYLTNKFKVCSPGIRNANDVNQLINFLYQAYTTLPMVNYPYPANFLMPLPAFPITVVCDRIANGMVKNPTDYLDAILQGANVYYNYTGSIGNCNNLTAPDSPSLGDEGWDVQSCNEMVMPIGNYPDTDMFLSAPWNLDYQKNYCYQKWKVVPRENYVITHYGGKRILKEATNIVFSNGQFDPWRGGGVNIGTEVNEKIKLIYIEKGAHHLDLRSSNPLDPQSVVQARQQEVNEIRKWINEFYSERRIKRRV